MIIYSVTVKVWLEIADDFVEWMSSRHIPEVIETRCFQQAYFCRLNSEYGNAEKSFCIQYHCANQEMLDQYLQDDAPALRKEFNDRYGEKCILSRQRWKC